MIQTRQELLDGLYRIKHEVEIINKLHEELRGVQSKFRTHENYVSTDKFHDITYLLYKSCVIGGFLATIITIITFELYGFLLFPVIMAYIILKKNDISKIKRLIEKLFVACLIFVVPISIPRVIFTPAVLGLSFFIMKAYLKKEELRVKKINNEIKNRNIAIDEYNKQIYEQASKIENQIIEHIQQAMVIGSDWFPRSYYTLYAIEQFIHYVSNFQADTVKGMVNCFEQAEYQKSMIEQQHQMNEMMKQGIRNQEQLSNQIRFSNILQVGQLVSNWELQKSIDNLSHVYKIYY